MSGNREVRKFSWFIGSTAGILLTAPIMLLWLVNGGAFLAHHFARRARPACTSPWIALVFAQLLGSLIARAGWWAATR